MDLTEGSLDALLDLADSQGAKAAREVFPLIEIARTEHKPEALEALERWKARHPEVARHLEAADVLVDAMRGRSSAWYRIRVNLRHVPEAERPEQGPLEADYNPWPADGPWPTNP